MSRIPAVDPNTAPASVQKTLSGVERGLGVLPNLFRVAAGAPAALEAMVAFFGATAKGGLDAATREAVALAVSEANACDYCLSAHTALGKGAGLGADALSDARLAKSSDPRLAAILELARAVVDRRGRVGDAAIEKARRAHLDDAEILEVVANVALTTFTNYVNEVAGTEIDFPVVRHHPR